MRARLINPELLTIEPLSRTSALEDSVSGEPMGIARAAAVQVLAQVDELDLNTRRPAQAGADLRVNVKISFLRRTLQAAGYSPADGDRVVAIADKDGSNSRAVTWYLRGAQPWAKERHGAKLVTCRATDRPAGRDRAEGELW